MARSRRYRRLSPAFIEACRTFRQAREGSNIWFYAVRWASWRLLQHVAQFGETILVSTRAHRQQDQLAVVASLVAFTGDVLGEEVE